MANSDSTNLDSIPTALITGASRGLGLALATELARRGWNLVIDARGVDALTKVAIELAKKVRVEAVPGDVADPNHRRDLALAARDLGGLDVLVNNAGVLGPSPQPGLVDYPLEELERVLRINTVAPLGVVQALAPWLRDGARIVNITSDAAIEPYEGWGGYAASKAALQQWGAVLAAEHPAWKVYAVDPGDMRTQMHQEAFPGEDIGDRPLPQSSVPGLVDLLGGERPSGRYAVRELATIAA
jgi:NAD(P)-dependent dehydrogenase (short-subunit alcohol dehydrogenase family)